MADKSSYHQEAYRLPLSDEIHKGVDSVLWEIIGVLARVLIKVPKCLKNDFRLTGVQKTPRFLVLF